MIRSFIRKFSPPGRVSLVSHLSDTDRCEAGLHKSRIVCGGSVADVRGCPQPEGNTPCDRKKDVSLRGKQKALLLKRKGSFSLWEGKEVFLAQKENALCVGREGKAW